MHYYRIHIKLDGQEVREFTIDDPRINIEYVYMEYKKRVNAKNGAGRVIYFDLVMISEASLSCQEDRDETFKQENNYRINPVKKDEIWKKKKRDSSNSFATLG